MVQTPLNNPDGNSMDVFVGVKPKSGSVPLTQRQRQPEQRRIDQHDGRAGGRVQVIAEIQPDHAAHGAQQRRPARSWCGRLRDSRRAEALEVISRLTLRVVPTSCTVSTTTSPIRMSSRLSRRRTGRPIARASVGSKEASSSSFCTAASTVPTTSVTASAPHRSAGSHAQRIADQEVAEVGGKGGRTRQHDHAQREHAHEHDADGAVLLETAVLPHHADAQSRQHGGHQRPQQQASARQKGPHDARQHRVAHGVADVAQAAQHHPRAHQGAQHADQHDGQQRPHEEIQIAEDRSANSTAPLRGCTAGSRVSLRPKV